MRMPSLKLAVVIALSSAALAHGDLWGPALALTGSSICQVAIESLPAQSWAVLPAEVPVIVCDSLPSAETRMLEGWPDPLATESWRLGAGSGLPVNLAADQPLVVRELPPEPGAGLLTITGLLPLGAWQVLRSARKVHLGSLPAWYHPSAPHRIGHAVAYDLDVSLLPLCVFDTVCALDNARYGPPEFTHRDCPRRPGSQYFLPATAPRGPPHASREPALIPAGGRAFAHTDPGIDALTYTHFVSRTAKRVYRKE